MPVQCLGQEDALEKGMATTPVFLPKDSFLSTNLPEPIKEIEEDNVRKTLRMRF